MKIQSFTQTPFITHDEQNLLRVKVESWDYCNPFCPTRAALQTLHGKALAPLPN